MKKIILFALLNFIVIPIFADNTNYPLSNECRIAVEEYSKAAYYQERYDLAKWFFNFATEDKTVFNCVKQQCTAELFYGCAVSTHENTFEQKIWPKMQIKLNQQIGQLQTNQPGLYKRASLICEADTHYNINFDSCQ